VIDKVIVVGDLIAFAGSEFVYSLVEDDAVVQPESSNKMIFAIIALVAVSAIAAYFLM